MIAKILFVTIALAILGTAPALCASAAGIDLGKDLSGESCHLQNKDVVCGTEEGAVGLLWSGEQALSLPSDVAARAASLLTAAQSVPGNGLENVTCDGANPLGGDNLLLACTARDTDRPQIILVSANARGLWGAEGLPAMLPVLEAAIAVSSGESFSSTQTAAAQSIVQAKFSSRLLQASAADYSGYLKAIDQGRQDGGTGNFSAAESAYRSALDIETRLFGPDSFAVGQVLIELAVQVSNQGRFDEAAALFRRADPIIQSATGVSARARLASYRALDAANQRHYGDALQYARDAVAARRKDIDDAKSPSLDVADQTVDVPPALEGELAHDLWLEAEMAMRTRDLPGAEAAAQEALYIVTQQADLPLSWRPQMVSLMGEINARENRVAVAERDLQEAASMDQKIFGNGTATAMAQLQLGAFYADQQVYPAAIAAFRDAFKILDKDEIARVQIAADQITPFLEAASATSATAEERRTLNEEMFLAIQRIDSGIADQTIARVAARQAATDPKLADEVRGAEDAARVADGLRIALASEHAKSDDDRDAVREKSFSVQLDAATAQSDALLAKVRTDFPAYTVLASPHPVPLNELQSQLGPHEAFVSFVIGVRASYVLLATSAALTVSPLNATETSLAADVNDLRSAFVPHVGKLPDFSLKLSHGLYHTLLGPVEPQLGGIDHLVIASSGALASLPFSLLVTEDPGQENNYSDAAWLIRRMAIAQVPSARAFITLRTAKRAVAPLPFLGLGNPTFSGGSDSDTALAALASACQQAGTVDPSSLNSLPPLPDTADEVRAVANDLGASPNDVLLGANATEDAFRAKPLERYAVIYFATHGLLPGELHCQTEPSLVLSPPNRDAVTAANDGLLSASEIAILRLNADLVVLSACNTAAAGGTGFGGGALDGLADAFFNAGARAVLASNWQVPSTATMQLMTAVFANLARDSKHDVTEALRQAQLSMISEGSTAHPFDWAAFTFIGAGGGQT
jgi:CHAT domain-containing protein/tetratricopeptide (TPR) repeat protein